MVHHSPKVDPDASIGLPAVKSNIDRLYVLVVGIRRSARQPHTLKRKNQPGDSNPFCLKLLERRYPKGRSSLLKQLAHSIHVRGTSLQYLQSHNWKLAYRREDCSAYQQVMDGIDPQIHGMPITAQSTLTDPETMASAISPSEVIRLRQVARGRVKPSYSITSSGSTVRDEGGQELNYPPMPKAEPGKKYASCSICSEPLKIGWLTEESWE